jgi:hypothetical protein
MALPSQPSNIALPEAVAPGHPCGPILSHPVVPVQTALIAAAIAGLSYMDPPATSRDTRMTHESEQMPSGVVKLTFPLAQLPSRVPYSPYEHTTRPQPV